MFYMSNKKDFNINELRAFANNANISKVVASRLLKIKTFNELKRQRFEINQLEKKNPDFNIDYVLDGTNNMSIKMFDTSDLPF